MAGRKPDVPKGYASGPYAVGTCCFSLTDTGRREVLGDGKGDRKIAVRMYYPVTRESVAGMPQAEVFSAPKIAALLKAYHLKSISDELNRAEYYEHAPWIPEQQFPLIMFSMGYNSYVESNTYLLCALASQGYIIASVGHAHEAVENDYEDGSTDVFDQSINKRMYTSFIGALWSQRKLMHQKGSQQEILEQFEQFQNKYTPYIKDRVPQWEQDILKALEAVQARYGEHIDQSRGIGASGHSLGGCLAYYLCRYHAPFSCGINIDGGLFGDYPDRVMEKPFCQISCGDNINVETRPFLQTTADTYQVIFKNMKHMGFTDAKFYIPIKMLSGKMDAAESLRHLVYCHRTFFDKYLKGADVRLDGLASEEVTYRKIV